VSESWVSGKQSVLGSKNAFGMMSELVPAFLGVQQKSLPAQRPRWMRKPAEVSHSDSALHTPRWPWRHGPPFWPGVPEACGYGAASPAGGAGLLCVGLMGV
jgi:hypothetical protein